MTEQEKRALFSEKTGLVATLNTVVYQAFLFGLDAGLQKTGGNADLRAVAVEIASRKRPDPSKGDSNAGRWVTLTLPREMMDRLDDALAKLRE